MQNDLFRQLSGLVLENKPAALATRLSDGLQCLMSADGVSGPLPLDAEGRAGMKKLLAERRCAHLGPDGGIFVRVYARPYRLIIIGAVHIARYLAPMARMANFEVIVIEPRQAFARMFDIPGVRLVAGWPDDVLPQMGVDESTAIATLTHDPKIDDAALAMILSGPAFYIGSLGSRRTHEKRVRRMAELGLEGFVDRIASPIGLDLGGREPAEIAVSILAQIIQQRYAA